MKTTKTITLGEVKEILKKHFKAKKVDIYLDKILGVTSASGSSHAVVDQTFLFDLVVEE